VPIVLTVRAPDASVACILPSCVVRGLVLPLPCFNGSKLRTCCQHFYYANQGQQIGHKHYNPYNVMTCCKDLQHNKVVTVRTHHTHHVRTHITTLQAYVAQSTFSDLALFYR